MSDYQILPEFMLRTPALPFRAFQVSTLQEIIDRPDFRAALYLANSLVYQELKKLNFNLTNLSPKLALTIYNYANRMAYRTTPFGAFSSFCFINASENSPGIIFKENEIQLHISPDLDEFLIQYNNLIRSTTTELQANCSIYYTSSDGRYIFAEHTAKGPFSYSTRNFNRNPVIESLLKFAKQPKKIELLIRKLSSFSMTDCEAGQLIADLRAAQLLLPSNMPSITGKDTYQDFLAICRQYDPLPFPDPELHLPIEKVLNREAFYQLPHQSYKSVVAANQNVKFYANMERQLQCVLPKNILNSLKDAVFALRKLSVSKDPPALTRYIKAFKAKFDLRIIPLMEAIDPEAGISYDNLAAPASQCTISDKIMPFLEKSASDELLTWGKVNKLLLNNWPVNAGGAIELTEKLLNELEEHQQTIPPSFSVLFRVSDNHIQIDQAGGTSATALIGRFTPFSHSIRDHAREIAYREATLNPEIIFAEVAIISDPHVDNINRRETVRDYEIPIMTGSQLPFDQQIMVSDLFLMVRENKLILWSETLQRQIIPRISSAFNYKRNNLAVFRLLGDLQYQGMNHTYSFDPQVLLPGLSYYPRVKFKNCILSLASWNIQKKDILSDEPIMKQGKHDLTPECFLRFAKKIGLSQIFALSVSDRSLVYRLDQMEDLRFFLAEIKTLASFQLKEVVLEAPNGGIVTDSNGNTFSNQFIASIINKNASYPRSALNKPAITPNREKREMITGSDWIYYKLYGQPFNTDAVLLKLGSALEAQQKSGMIYEWFFVRYLDPRPHLRLRIRLKQQNIGTIIVLLEIRLKNLQKKYKLTEIQTATYHRELERYPEKIISLVEASFCLSTRMVIRAIKTNKLTQQTPIYLTGVIPAYWLINDWIKEPSKRLEFITNVRDHLFKEFGGSAALQVALDESKRLYKNETAQSITEKEFFSVFGLKREWRDWRALMTNISLSVTKNREQLLADLLHMHFNRVFHTQMREQELVAYALMHQYELSTQKRKR